MAELKLENLSKRYPGGTWALEGIHLQIRSGEFVVFVGPSGCGKSTLLRLVAGLESLNSGRIELDGRRVDGLAPAERGIGMVFQDYALYPHMNVWENLAFGLKMRKLPREEIRARVTETSEMLGLSGLLSRKPSQLSGGQRQRVAIGRALVKRPAVLLLDEPLSNLDAQLRAQTRLEIAALHRRIRSTTLYVTHDQEEAMTLADRIVVLDRGRVQQFDTPLSLYREPENRFVASFIGHPGMSFLEGKLERRSEGASFQIYGQGQGQIQSATPAQTLRFKSPRGLPPSGFYQLGFRPESWSLPESPPATSRVAPVLQISLRRIEQLGHEIQIVGSANSTNLRLRTSDASIFSRLRGLRPEEAFAIELHPSELHWFETGERGRRIAIQEAPPRTAA